MTVENFRAGIDRLLREVEERPADRHALWDRIHEKIAQYQSLGQPLPEDIARLYAELDDDDVFDNFPV
ncbi:hypothetical protein C8N32_11744 [Rhodovulum imhoffii]|uniref:Uncharacterized protein n=1 Tax=Rhodovulum imhoffii TaxID=365340 RepID=A0A2T5BPU7_9RHOB|nr:hypothetical protein [Rhodovulum imhoffii]MBK5934180.1 hypothetical protein [Rhodovulum imhoffii]PTN01096.1 hypothetical protein C8N32_11744 [Rhodovulum imhoffii]